MTPRGAKLLVSVALLFASACQGGRTTATVSAFELRAAVANEAWNQFSVEDRRLLSRGQFRAGMPEVALYIARGRPFFHWPTKIDGHSCRVLLYADGGEEALLDRVVYSCNGVIAHHDTISPELPCWRVNEVSDRVVEKDRYFSSVELPRQWDIVTGLLKRGQSNRDVYIAFGKPYNTGREVREDGSSASTQVFLDHGGDSYGLYITFIDRRVVGWKIPADRELTPEAQKRRLEAMEERLTAKLNEMEERADRRHRETVDHLKTIQDNQAEIRADIAEQTRAVAVAAALGASVGASFGSSSSGGGSLGSEYDSSGGGDTSTAEPTGDGDAFGGFASKAPSCKCPKITCPDGYSIIQSCRAMCGGSTPSCDCRGRCQSKKERRREHVCKCR